MIDHQRQGGAADTAKQVRQSMPLGMQFDMPAERSDDLEQ